LEGLAALTLSFSEQNLNTAKGLPKENTANDSTRERAKRPAAPMNRHSEEFVISCAKREYGLKRAWLAQSARCVAQNALF
jgi:hypothetical protein